jgi:hypothetical protein
MKIYLLEGSDNDKYSTTWKFSKNSDKTESKAQIIEKISDEYLNITNIGTINEVKENKESRKNPTTKKVRKHVDKVKINEARTIINDIITGSGFKIIKQK